MGGNALSGTVPATFGLLTDLRVLGLFGGNSFVGTLPPALVARKPRNLASPAVTLCPRGSAANGTLLTSGPAASAAWPAPVCAPCPPGKVAPVDGATFCSDCPAYTFATGDGVSCTDCPANTVSPAGAAAAASCVCLAGYAPSPPGAGNAPGTCVPCLVAGTYANGSACAPCPRGSTSPGLSDGLVKCTCADGSHPPLAGCAAVLEAPPAGPADGLTTAALGGVLGGALGGALLATVAAALLVRRERRRAAAAAARAAERAGWRAFIASDGEVVLGDKIGCARPRRRAPATAQRR